MQEFRPLSTLLAAVLPSRGEVPVSDHAQRELARCWGLEAGAAAHHSRPLLFTSGRLVVFAESASWGSEIRHRAQRLTHALAGHGIALNRIEVKILPDAPPPGGPE